MLYLSIDQGGSSSRAFVVDHKGEVVVKSQVAVTTYRKGRIVEQDPVEIVNSIRQCIDNCLAQLSQEQCKKISSAALVTQRSSFLAVYIKTGQALTKVISWQDTRGQTLLSSLQLNHSQLNKLTGLRVSAHYGASKMAWCLLHQSEVKLAAKNNTLMFV